MKNNLKKLQTDFWEIIQYETIGKRSAMEDYSDLMVPFTSSDSSLLLSVFDGHAGPRCAQFLCHALPSEIRKETMLLPVNAPSNAGLPGEEVFKKIFKALDQMWLDSAGKKEPKIEDGSTALCVALEGSDLVIANCGDCRAVLSQAGQTMVLTRDHKPTDEAEHQRIVNQGGTVIGGRLQGKLAVSRAFGNYDFKESEILSSEPEIHHITLSPDVEYLVVGSDGLYEHFTNEEIISFIKNGLQNNNLETVVKELVEEALDRGSEDNITIVVVKFEKGFKKLLKKRAKKQQSGKSPVLPGKNCTKSPVKASISDSPTEPSKPTGIFKKAHKINNSGKNCTSSSASSSAESVTPTKKKLESKKLKACEKTFKLPSPRHEKPYVDEEKWNRFVKPFKYDFFGSRTPVTISG